MHCRENLGAGPMTSRQISPLEFVFRGWPSGPLAEWQLEVLDYFFETLGALVEHEGTIQ